MCGWLSRIRGWSCKGGGLLVALKGAIAMLWRRFSSFLSLLTFVGLSPLLGAQQGKTLKLGEVLERLQANLDHYDAGVPSLFCDEQVVSSRTEPGERDLKITTNSVFWLKRTLQADQTTTLVESREVKSVDQEPPSSQPEDEPALLSGLFEGGLAVVSVSQTSCINYKLEQGKRTGPIVVRFATMLTPRNTADCFLQEESKGQVYIDPASMQVKRLEITTPRHLIVDQESYRAPETGRRELTVEYAPVLLGSESFWMPSSITMRTTSGSGFDVSVWTFRATYRNYHRLEVKSRILDTPMTVVH
jgi:hypothetical protein